MRRITTVCLAFCLAGCASTRGGYLEPRAVNLPPPPPPSPIAPVEAYGGYRASDFAWSTRVGTNAVLGQVVRHGRDGSGWSCVGQSAGLTPETRYSAERIRLLYGSPDQAVESVESVRARSLANPGADYAQFVRSTTCDARSTFAFRNLPDGAYFLIVRVHARGRDSGNKAAVIMQRLDLRGGTVRQISLPAINLRN